MVWLANKTAGVALVFVGKKTASVENGR